MAIADVHSMKKQFKIPTVVSAGEMCKANKGMCELKVVKRSKRESSQSTYGNSF